MVRAPPCHGGGQGFEPLSGRLLNNFQLQLNIWGLSSAGRASALQAEGHRFEPYRPHMYAELSWIERLTTDQKAGSSNLLAYIIDKRFLRKQEPLL